MDGWTIDREPTMRPDPERHPEELWGIEDPRITYVDELGKYVVAYTAFSRGGPGVALALTEDFRTFERLGLVMQPDDKEAVLLPRRPDVSTGWAQRCSTSRRWTCCRGDSWIFGPETDYEREGDVGYVTFPCGYTIDGDDDGINLYYRAADTSVALARGSISETLAWLDRHGSA